MIFPELLAQAKGQSTGAVCARTRLAFEVSATHKPYDSCIPGPVSVQPQLKLQGKLFQEFPDSRAQLYHQRWSTVCGTPAHHTMVIFLLVMFLHVFFLLLCFSLGFFLHLVEGNQLLQILMSALEKLTALDKMQEKARRMSPWTLDSRRVWSMSRTATHLPCLQAMQLCVAQFKALWYNKMSRWHAGQQTMQFNATDQLLSLAAPNSAGSQLISQASKAVLQRCRL